MLIFFFFFTLVTGPRRSLSLKLSDTRVSEPLVTSERVPRANPCGVDRLRGGVPREQKMLKGHLPRVIYHQVNLYTKIEQQLYSEVGLPHVARVFGSSRELSVFESSSDHRCVFLLENRIGTRMSFFLLENRIGTRMYCGVSLRARVVHLGRSTCHAISGRED